MDTSDIERSRSPKRRRVDDGDGTPEYTSSSPDELSIGYEKNRTRIEREDSDFRREPRDPRDLSYASSASPDELDHTIPTPRESEDYNESIADSRDGSAMLTPRAITPIPTKPKEAVFVPYKQRAVLHGHKRGVAAVRFSPDGKMIASCSADASIRIWDTATGKCLNVLEGHLAGISTLAWSPDSKTIASGSDDKAIRLWDVSTGKPYPHPLLGHHNYISTLCFSPKGNMIVSGSYDEAVFLWDVRTGRIMRSLPAHSDPVGGVDFVEDGTLIASCAGDGLIRIWDTMSGQCLRTLVHEDNASVQSVKFSPNGKFVLAWTLDGCVRLWDYVQVKCMKTYQGHANAKYGLIGAFGVYGNNEGGREWERVTKKAFVVSGSEDGGMLWWDVVSKDVLQRVDAHDGVILGVDTWDGDGLVVSCGLDKTVRIWEKTGQQNEAVGNGTQDNGEAAME